VKRNKKIDSTPKPAPSTAARYLKLFLSQYFYPGFTPDLSGNKKGLGNLPKPLVYLAPPDGLEPPT
jgi:hypothetical protein